MNIKVLILTGMAGAAMMSSCKRCENCNAETFTAGEMAALDTEQKVTKFISTDGRSFDVEYTGKIVQSPTSACNGLTGKEECVSAGFYKSNRVNILKDSLTGPVFELDVSAGRQDGGFVSNRFNFADEFSLALTPWDVTGLPAITGDSSLYTIEFGESLLVGNSMLENVFRVIPKSQVSKSKFSYIWISPAYGVVRFKLNNSTAVWNGIIK